MDGMPSATLHKLIGIELLMKGAEIDLPGCKGLWCLLLLPDSY